jgi:hypothetical protein
LPEREEEPRSKSTAECIVGVNEKNLEADWREIELVIKGQLIHMMNISSKAYHQDRSNPDGNNNLTMENQKELLR